MFMARRMMIQPNEPLQPALAPPEPVDPAAPAEAVPLRPQTRRAVVAPANARRQEEST